MPGAIEADRARVAGGVAAEIEGPGLRERKHVVVELVGVREVDRRAGRDREHVRHERLVALIHHGVAALARLERAARRRFQIDDRAQQVGQVAPGRRAEIRDARPPLDRRRGPPQLDAAADRCPAARAAGRPRHKGRQGHQGHEDRTARRDRDAVRPLCVLCSLCVLVMFLIRTSTPAAPRTCARPAAGRRRRGCRAETSPSAADCAGANSRRRSRTASPARPTAASPPRPCTSLKPR